MDDFLLSLPPAKDLQAASSNDLTQEKFSILKDYVAEIRCESKALVYSYIRLGQIFTDIHDNNLYYSCLVGGMRYNDFFAFMYAVFGFKKSTVYNLMTVYKRFSTTDCKVSEEYSDYSYSQLVELVSISDDKKKMERISPEMTVSEMRELKQFWRSDGFNVTAKDWKDELQTARERHAEESIKQKKEKRRQGILNLLNSDKGETDKTEAKATSEVNASVAAKIITSNQIAGIRVGDTRLRFKSDKERKDFINVVNCKKWNLYIVIPDLSLEYRRFIFANGDSLIAEFGHYYPNYQTDPNKAQDYFRLHLQTKEQPVFNCEGIAPTYVVEYMKKHKDEI
ncbi:MAG: hypothetical protein LUD27_02695 [Clostridia bacterium]|nr:hypothetical protein [Clostridia bacterium]